MYRVSILKIDGTRESENLDTKDLCEEWILKKLESGNIKKSIIVNRKDIHDRYITNWE